MAPRANGNSPKVVHEPVVGLTTTVTYEPRNSSLSN